MSARTLVVLSTLLMAACATSRVTISQDQMEELHEKGTITVSGVVLQYEEQYTVITVKSYVDGLYQALAGFNDKMARLCKRLQEERPDHHSCGGPHGVFALGMIGTGNDKDPHSAQHISVFMTNTDSKRSYAIKGSNAEELFESVWHAGDDQEMSFKSKYDGLLLSVVKIPDRQSAFGLRGGTEILMVNGVEEYITGAAVRDSIMLELRNIRMTLASAYEKGQIPFVHPDDLKNPKVRFDVDVSGVVEDRGMTRLVARGHY